jgi:hypothetical protein
VTENALERRAMTVADFSAVRRPLALASHAPGALYASPSNV